MQLDLFVFDLDGTLIDSKLDLALAVNAARGHVGMGPLEHERIYSYVGNTRIKDLGRFGRNPVEPGGHAFRVEQFFRVRLALAGLTVGVFAVRCVETVEGCLKARGIFDSSVAQRWRPWQGFRPRFLLILRCNRA